MAGRTVVVFGGGGGGMGTETSLALARAGAEVVVADISDERVHETVALISDAGGRAVGRACDVREIGDLEAVFALAGEEFGRFDGVVNIVGGARVESAGGTVANASTWNPLHEYSEELWQGIFALNIDYVFHSCSIAAREMIRSGNGGTIVNFASVSALAGSAYNAPYGAAKAGVISLTRSLSLELGEYGVRANCVVPGSVPAPLAKNASPSTYEAIANRASRKSPLGRQVHPGEIAGAVLFFSSALSSGITGQSLTVDVGASANSPLGTWEEYRESMRIRHAESAR